MFTKCPVHDALGTLHTSFDTCSLLSELEYEVVNNR